MAITYPVNTPTEIGIANINLRAASITGVNTSIFTFKQQVFSFAGQRWEATIDIPPVLRDKAEPWVSFLLSLRGRVGTFLLGDPNCAAPQGTISSATLTGSAGDGDAALTMTGTLVAGDYIQLGTGLNAKLHKVIQDISGNGDVELWPNLKEDYTSETVIFTNPKGLFRLGNNVSDWTIDNSNFYSIRFECVEAV